MTSTTAGASESPATTMALGTMIVGSRASLRNVHTKPVLVVVVEVCGDVNGYLHARASRGDGGDEWVELVVREVFDAATPRPIQGWVKPELVFAQVRRKKAGTAGSVEIVGRWVDHSRNGTDPRSGDCPVE
jgi:hypothetical protein